MSGTSCSNPVAASGKSSGPRPGLRERNKARTRNAIRTAALDLFERQGYTETTVAQIAEAAEVSHTTFFRYFQNKESVVLDDGLDRDARLAMLEAIEPGLDRFDLVRRIITDMYEYASGDEWATNPVRLRLIRTEPTLAAAALLESDETLEETNGFIARYLGVAPDDVRLRVFMAAVKGVMFHVVDNSGVSGFPSIQECVEALDLLEAGLPV